MQPTDQYPYGQANPAGAAPASTAGNSNPSYQPAIAPTEPVPLPPALPGPDPSYPGQNPAIQSQPTPSEPAPAWSGPNPIAQLQSPLEQIQAHQQAAGASLGALSNTFAPSLPEPQSIPVPSSLAVSTQIPPPTDRYPAMPEPEPGGNLSSYQRSRLAALKRLSIAPKIMPGGIADPGPLGLAAFATTTFVLSIANAGLVTSAAKPALALGLFYGGLVQLIAGMWEFKRNNTFGAVAFSSYGAFWLGYWYYASSIAPTLNPADAGVTAGCFLLAWTIFTSYMTVAALRTSIALLAVFCLLTLTFLLLTMGELSGSTGLIRAGGWFGLMTAFAAWYASAAGVINTTFQRWILPVGPQD